MPTIRDALLKPFEPNDMGLLSINGRYEPLAVTRQVIEAIDLGIKLFINGALWPLNNTVNFTYPTLPRMEAVPVKRIGSVLSAGAFSASATVVVALQ